MINVWSEGGLDPHLRSFSFHDFRISAQLDFSDASIDDEFRNNARADIGPHVFADVLEFFQGCSEVFRALERVCLIDSIGFYAELAELAEELDEDFGVVIDAFHEHRLAVERDIVLGAEEEGADRLGGEFVGVVDVRGDGDGGGHAPGRRS